MNRYDKLRKDLFTELQSKPFPVRGWHLSMHFATGEKFAYPVHKLGEVVMDDDGVPINKPEVIFEIPSQELVLTADFRLEANTSLCGQPFTLPPGAKDTQWLCFANSDGTLEVILDGKFVPPFQERLIYPKQDDWLYAVKHWSKLWQMTDKRNKEARWILTQLTGIRDSANHMLDQSLKRLAHRIESTVPDYWMFAELAMCGLLREEEIKALHEHPTGQGGIKIRETPRPREKPTETVQ